MNRSAMGPITGILAIVLMTWGGAGDESVDPGASAEVTAVVSAAQQGDIGPSNIIW